MAASYDSDDPAERLQWVRQRIQEIGSTKAYTLRGRGADKQELKDLFAQEERLLDMVGSSGRMASLALPTGAR